MENQKRELVLVDENGHVVDRKLLRHKYPVLFNISGAIYKVVFGTSDTFPKEFPEDYDFSGGINIVRQRDEVEFHAPPFNSSWFSFAGMNFRFHFDDVFTNISITQQGQIHIRTQGRNAGNQLYLDITLEEERSRRLAQYIAQNFNVPNRIYIGIRANDGSTQLASLKIIKHRQLENIFLVTIKNHFQEMHSSSSCPTF